LPARFRVPGVLLVAGGPKTGAHDTTAVRAASSDADAALDGVHRREWARVLAATVRVTRDLDLAEECVQEAYAQALVAWDRDGIPDNPAGWLVTAARRRAVDAIRREQSLRTKLPLLIVPEDAGPSTGPDEKALNSMVISIRVPDASPGAPGWPCG